MAKKTKASETRKLNEALSLLEEDKFSREEIADYMKEAIKTAYKKICNDAKLEVEIDDKFQITMHEVRTVASDDKDDYEDYEITLEEAQTINPNYQIGDEIRTPVTMDVFGRTDSSKIKNMLKQKIRESQKTREYEFFKSKEQEIMTGIVERIDPKGNYAIINLGQGQLAYLNKKAMIPGEMLTTGQEIKVFIQSVTDQIEDKKKGKDENGEEVIKYKKGTFVQISRKDDGLVRRLFESVVTEIVSNGKPGPVEILGIAREAGKRCKVAVDSSDPNVDPIGACVGIKGTRAKSIQDELGGEKVDIVKYDKNIKRFIANSLSPAQIADPEKDVILNQETREAFVIVDESKSSLAIGKGGINTKLASQLIKVVSDYKGKGESWTIKIKSTQQAIDEDLYGTGKDEEFVTELREADIVESEVKKVVEKIEVEEKAPVFVENEISLNADVDSIISEINKDLSQVHQQAVEIEVEDDDDNYEDDEYIDRLEEFEDLYD